jgi:hypothetical protein
VPPAVRPRPTERAAAAKAPDRAPPPPTSPRDSREEQAAKAAAAQERAARNAPAQLPVQQLPPARSQPAPTPAAAPPAVDTTVAQRPAAVAPAPTPPVVASQAPASAALEGAAAAAPFDPVAEKGRVDEMLSLYAGAIEDLSIDRLKRVWPGVSAQTLGVFQNMFDQARSIDVSITDCSIEVAPTRATATCRVRQTYRPKRGTRENLNATETFTLRRAGQGWVIESRTSN